MPSMLRPLLQLVLETETRASIMKISYRPISNCDR